MRGLRLIVLFSVAFLNTNAQSKSSNFKFSISLLEGKWFVVASNYSMWLNPKNTDPYFTYNNFSEKNGHLKFDDCVTYKKNSNEKK